MQTRSTTHRRGLESAEETSAGHTHPTPGPHPGEGPPGQAGRGGPASPPGGAAADALPGAPASAGSRLALRNWRVRTRLLAAVIIPIVAALLLGGMRISSEMRAAEDLERVRRLVGLAELSTALAHALQAERDTSAVHVAGDRKQNPQRLTEARARVDELVDGYRIRSGQVDSSYSGLVRARLETAGHDLGTLGALRNTTLNSKLPALSIVKSYTTVITNVLAVNVEIASHADDSRLTESTRSLDALSHAKERASYQRAVLGAALTKGRFTREEFDGLVLSDQQREAAADEFAEVADPKHRQLFEDTVTGPEIDTAALTRSKALARAAAPKLDLSATTYLTAATGEIERMRTVEAGLVGTLKVESLGMQTTAQRFALLVSLLILLIVVLALGATLLVARSMVRPLQTLRTSALDVAERRLPQAIRALESSGGTGDRPAVAPTPVTSLDEIGQVARAFDQVHSEAVRLAGEQAVLRDNVNAMFVNLSRRSQSLVERQLRLIDSLENNESDPDQLASLFRLDHLATRMRRNSENLLVLAGEEPGRRWSEPVPLIDVLRAAASEVEQYERVDLRGLPPCRIAGRAVNDLVHLVAELLENATTFSSPETRVLVTSQLLDDGSAMIEVEDRGIGMPPAQLTECNERLAGPVAVDPSVARRMGLFVISRLADRHQIRVQLRRSTSGGITALVVTPPELVLASAEDDPAVLGARSQARALPPGPTSTPERPQRAVAPAPPPPIPRQAAAGGTTDFGLPGEPASTATASGQEAPPPATDTRPASAEPPAGPPTGRYSADPASSSSTQRAREPIQEPIREPAPEPPQPAGDPLAQPRTAAGHGTEQGTEHGTELSVEHTTEFPAVTRDSPPLPTRPVRRRQATTEPPTGVSDDTVMSPIYRPGVSDDNALDPHTPLAGAGGGDRLPIFEAIESEWFRRRVSRRSFGTTMDKRPGRRRDTAAGGDLAGTGPGTSGPGRPGPGGDSPRPATPATGERTWRSPGDEAWRAAEAISKPTTAGLTPAGLPIRIPKAHFVPGSAGKATSPTGTVGDTARSPEAVRGRLARFQQGVRRGRDAGRDSERDGHGNTSGERTTTEQESP